MILLSIDTCDTRGSIALLQDGVLVKMVPHDYPEEYSSWLLPAVEALLRGESLAMARSEEHTSELQSRQYLVCRDLHFFPTRRSSDLAGEVPCDTIPA